MSTSMNDLASHMYDTLRLTYVPGGIKIYVIKNGTIILQSSTLVSKSEIDDFVTSLWKSNELQLAQYAMNKYGVLD